MLLSSLDTFYIEYIAFQFQMSCPNMQLFRRFLGAFSSVDLLRSTSRSMAPIQLTAKN